MSFTPVERNFENIQFADIRANLDTKYNSLHDELSDCYYNKKPFKNYGVLDKTTFDKLHGLIFHMREVEFHKENKKRTVPYSEDLYNNEFDENGEIVTTKVERSVKKIDELKNEGLVLEID